MFYLSFSQPTSLKLRSISSEEVTQQGDPLDSLLFYVTIQPLLHILCSELVVAYIDNVVIGWHIL